MWISVSPVLIETAELTILAQTVALPVASLLRYRFGNPRQIAATIGGAQGPIWTGPQTPTISSEVRADSSDSRAARWVRKYWALFSWTTSGYADGGRSVVHHTLRLALVKELMPKIRALVCEIDAANWRVVTDWTEYAAAAEFTGDFRKVVFCNHLKPAPFQAVAHRDTALFLCDRHTIAGGVVLPLGIGG